MAPKTPAIGSSQPAFATSLSPAVFPAIPIPVVAGPAQADAVRVSRSAVTRAYESLYATDLAIKQGRTEPETALLLCVLDLCGIAGADPRDLVVGEPPRR